MKTLLILYTTDDWSYDQPAFATLVQEEAYKTLYTTAEKEYGFTMARASITWFNGTGWTKYWVFENNTWVKKEELLIPALILDKSGYDYTVYPKIVEINQQFIVLNAWEITAIASDKMITSVVLGDYTPRTYLVRNAAELQIAIQEIPTPEIILKPQYGFGGKGVEIVSKDAAQDFDISAPYIVQAVIDASHGITGIIDGHHDLRVVIMGNSPSYAYIRTPQPGGRLANLAQGGTAMHVPLEKIPEAAQKMLSDVLMRFQGFQKAIYSIDFLFDENQRPWIIELNNNPGVDFRPEPADLRELGLKKHLEYFASLIG